MLQSILFTKTRREAPKDEIAINAKLLIRAGFIDKLSSGVYTYLPLGLLVLKKIEEIIRSEMKGIGAQEILMPSLQPKENWIKTGRWNTMDDLYKVVDKSGREFALGPTHEEVVVPLVKQFVSSYKDLPVSIFQIQNKFRMEMRAKSGMLRGREFIMKDLYSFHSSEEDFEEYYEKVKGSYLNIFKRVGLANKTILTYSSGGSFSKYSHEYQTITDSGEDIIYLCESCNMAINKEIIKEQKECPECSRSDFKEKKSIEVANIFPLKTKFSESFSLTFKDKEGESKNIIMGCYGIGLSRLMGAISEVHHNDDGILWPDGVSPFTIHLLSISPDDEKVKDRSDALYEKMIDLGIDVLYDDRNVGPGEKFKDSDLIGIPNRIVVSEKTIKKGKVELKKRGDKDGVLVDENKVLSL
jgi:prolyl-tRNA synthetase